MDVVSIICRLDFLFHIYSNCYVSSSGLGVGNINLNRLVVQFSVKPQVYVGDRLKNNSYVMFFKVSIYSFMKFILKALLIFKISFLTLQVWDFKNTLSKLTLYLSYMDTRELILRIIWCLNIRYLKLIFMEMK